MPLLKIKNTASTPPGYWRVPLPDGRMLYGGTLDDLASKLHEFRVINRLDLGDPSAEIQDYLCRQENAPKCGPANPAKPLPGVKASGGMVARFISAMTSWMLSRETVSQKEADLRAETCANCEHNTVIDDSSCWGCYALSARIMGIIGTRKTRVDSSLQSCNICGCVNAVQAWVPMDVLARVHDLNDFPVDNGRGVPCWKREWAERQVQKEA